MRNSSLDYRIQQKGLPHSRTSSLDLRHVRNNSADLNKLYKNDINLVFGPQQGKHIIILFMILVKKIVLKHIFSYSFIMG